MIKCSNILLLLWVECIDYFRSVSDFNGVVKLMLICGTKEFFLFEKLF